MQEMSHQHPAPKYTASSHTARH